MSTDTATADDDALRWPLAAAADLQDHLLAACNDLDRLQALLAHACDVLLLSFHGAHDQLPALRTGAPATDDCAAAPPALRSAQTMRHLLSVLLALICATAGSAAPLAPAARAEIDGLLARLAASTCAFNRNGSWHTAAEAVPHLLRASRINTPRRVYCPKRA